MAYRTIASLIFLFLSATALAQNPYIDSLKQVLASAPNDSALAAIQNQLSFEYVKLSEYNKARELTTKTLTLCRQNRSSSWSLRVQNQSYNILAIVAGELGEVQTAFRYYEHLVHSYKLLNDIEGLAATYGNLSILHLDRGNFPQALEYQFQSLKLEEERNNRQGVGDCYGNIALVYHDKGENDKALEYQKKSLKIDEELGDSHRIAISLSTLGNIYFSLGENQRALENLKRSKTLFEKEGDAEGVAGCNDNMAIIYQKMGDYSTAIDYHSKALPVFEELENVNGLINAYRNIGVLNLRIQQPAIARSYLQKSLRIATETMAVNEMMEAYKGLSEADSALGDYKSAFRYHLLYATTKDSLFNEEANRKSVAAEMNFDFEKKQQAAKLDQEKKEEVARQELQKQKLQRNGFIAGFALMLALAGVSYRSYRQKKLSHQEIQHQKLLVDQKQKEIIDSITYAQRLQQAILPPPQFIRKHLPETMIYYRPKDLVAGDFYWAETLDGKFFIAAADSTGHGVPGAMVSIICSTALSRAVKEFRLTETGRILDKTRELVLETFEKSQSAVNDGMDISLLCIDKNNRRISWSGANNPLWYFDRTGNMIEVKPDKQPIGRTDDPAPFSTHEIAYDEGLTFFLFTDGYPDQFGGDNGKKLKYKPFAQILKNACKGDLAGKDIELNTAFESWAGNLEQVDDVCVIGIRI
jgi:tetratricopeptide (TPR) repeat protein/serine phosphatase RsbU (regulator of sigma subunit)